MPKIINDKFKNIREAERMNNPALLKLNILLLFGKTKKFKRSLFFIYSTKISLK